MEENSKNSAWFRVILLIAAIPLCIYMKADFFNAVIYMFTLFLMGFRSKGSGAVKNIGMLMSLISPALLFMSAPVWIMGTYAAIVGVCAHMHSRRYVLGLIYIIVSFFLILLSLDLSVGLNVSNGSLFAAIRTEYYADRFLSYIFDLNIGLLGYIPVALIFFVIITIFNLVKKNWKHIFYLIGMVAMLGVFSFIAVYMDDNTYISAYSLWVMPMVICGVAFGTMNVVKTFYKAAMVIFSISITGIMLYVNVISGHTAGFNESSKYVMDNMPDMYSPHVGVFVEKLGDTSHSDIELIVNPQKYSGQMYVSSGVEDAGHIRKILIYGSDEEVTRIRGMIKAVEDKKDTLNSLFKNVPRDGRLHYINIPKSLIVTMV